MSMRYLPEQPGIYACVYTPSKPGSHAVNVMFGDQHISKSPFKVDVGPAWNSQIRAFGPGLEGGVVNQQAVFTVVTNGETGALGESLLLLTASSELSNIFMHMQASFITLH